MLSQANAFYLVQSGIKVFQVGLKFRALRQVGEADVSTVLDAIDVEFLSGLSDGVVPTIAKLTGYEITSLGSKFVFLLSTLLLLLMLLLLLLLLLLLCRMHLRLIARRAASLLLHLHLMLVLHLHLLLVLKKESCISGQ